MGTTKATIDQVRNRTHWNSNNIKPVDPVTLGLSTQLELDAIVRRAAEKRAREDAKKGKVDDGASLLPASETGADDTDEPLEEIQDLEANEADIDEADADEADEDQD